MIKLKTWFIKRGNRYTQIMRTEDMAVYLVDNAYDKYAEVFKVRVRKPDRYHDDEYEAYPCDEDFGQYAWCCSTRGSLEKVMKREFPNVEIPNIFKHL